MEYFIYGLQIIVGVSLINVWLIQPNKPTPYRGGEAKTIFEEFKVYGLPAWSCYAIGFIKVTLGIMLIAGIWVTQLTLPSAAGLALLLIGSVAMHLKIKDPLKKSFPAALFITMCLIIIITTSNLL